MIIYPVEFHRRLEQKWATRIDQIPLSQATRYHREIRTMTMITRTKTKRTRIGRMNPRSCANQTMSRRHGSRQLNKSAIGFRAGKYAVRRWQQVGT